MGDRRKFSLPNIEPNLGDPPHSRAGTPGTGTRDTIDCAPYSEIGGAKMPSLFRVDA
jgi:hypothetical protein